jgi:hypothetical protein
VRAALNQSAATVPYLFVSAHPYFASWSDTGRDGSHQAVRQGMENLAADAGFNADIAARLLDTGSNYDNAGVYGCDHLSELRPADRGRAHGARLGRDLGGPRQAGLAGRDRQRRHRRPRAAGDNGGGGRRQPDPGPVLVRRG